MRLKKELKVEEMNNGTKVNFVLWACDKCPAHGFTIVEGEELSEDQKKCCDA